VQHVRDASAADEYRLVALLVVGNRGTGRCVGRSGATQAQAVLAELVGVRIALAWARDVIAAVEHDAVSRRIERTCREPESALLVPGAAVEDPLVFEVRRGVGRIRVDVLAATDEDVAAMPVARERGMRARRWWVRGCRQVRPRGPGARIRLGRDLRARGSDRAAEQHE